ncbi:unnamed protein product [Ophioblennius macclurei]
MWATDREFEDGSQPSKRGCGVVSLAWSQSADPAWLSSPPGPHSTGLGGRRRSSVSDSGDTGIGTYCSEDDSSSSTTPLTQNNMALEDEGIPVVQVLPSPSSSSRRSLSAGQWNRSSQLSSPLTCPLVSPGTVDLKDHRPVRRWSSLTRLPSGPESSSIRTSSSQCYSDQHGSLDRGLLHGFKKESPPLNGDLYLPLSSSFLCSNLRLRSPGASPVCRLTHSSGPSSLEADLYLPSAVSSPIKHSRSFPDRSLPADLDSALSHPAEASSPIQSTLRTQKWLTEQMEFRPKAERARDWAHINATEPEDFEGKGQLPWQHGPQHDLRINQSSLPFNMLVKVKEGLLRQRELEIERQKQQILQLHARIRENELRAQQVLQSQKSWYDAHIGIEDSTMSKQTAGMLHRDEELSQKLAVAEWEVRHVNEFFKHVTQKYTEDIRKLEEKIKTRDRYICSLKKKRQRESNQNQEKQQRIETLERYLSELPTLDEVHVGAKQEKEAQDQAEDLEEAVSRLEESLQEGCAAMTEKDLQIELQAQREKELIASVQSLQQKVQQCLDDGVRVPMQDLKRLEVENRELLQQRDHSSKLFKQQKEQIDRLSSTLTATSLRLQKKRSLRAGHVKEDDTAEEVSLQQPPPAGGDSIHVETSKVSQLLKEMSLCLLDLQALCSILIQRAQGKEPSLSLLLGMKSFGVSSEGEEEEEGEAAVTEVEGLSFKLLGVGQLRRDIDELRKTISDATLSMWITAVSLSDGCL